MAIRPNGAIRRQLRNLFNLGAIGDLTDGQLLERFATRCGEAAELAFAALVERHGPMVLRVCRNRLRDPNDAEDAFQATFLVLVQKARSLWVRDSLGPWLHRIAHRVATRARSSVARRREHEQRAAATRPTLVSERGDWDELAALLHEEIDRLPERYRVPVVICDLQGLTHEKAARHLGWPVGTVKSRLARARELLRGRLSRRGLGLPAGLLIAEKGMGGAFRAVELVLPGTLVDSTVRAAAPFAAGKALAAGVISSRVAILIEEVKKTMFLTKLKLASVLVLLIGAAGAAGALAQRGAGSDKSRAVDQPQGPAPAESRRAPGVDSTPAPAPAYITQSRAMIITRLEEEVAEARARLDRTLRRVRSPDDPAVVRATKTLEDLQQRLDRIDRVLVDVVETYPTMFDFSGGPADSASSSQPAAGAIRNTEDVLNFLSVASPNEADLARAKDRAEWAKRMFAKGYVSKSQLDAALADYERVKARSQANQPQQGSKPGGQQSQQPARKPDQHGESPDNGQPSQRQNDNSMQRQSSDSKQPRQGQNDNSIQRQSSDSKQPGQGQKDDSKQGESPGKEQRDQAQSGQEKGKDSPRGQRRDP